MRRRTTPERDVHALSSHRFTAQPAAARDVPVLVQLLEAYMRETFKAPWHGSAEALRHDGFGREFEMHVAMTDGEHVMGFLAWKKSYDLHHCLRGGEILDLYVSPDYRSRGVAPVLVCAVAAEILRRGGAYVNPGSRGSGRVRGFLSRRGSSLCRHGDMRYDATSRQTCRRGASWQ
jgi:GNAT superfamily N-acetyltransferase